MPIKNVAIKSKDSNVFVDFKAQGRAMNFVMDVTDGKVISEPL